MTRLCAWVCQPARHGLQSHGADGGERLAWLDRNRSPAFTGQRFGGVHARFTYSRRRFWNCLFYFCSPWGCGFHWHSCCILRLRGSNLSPRDDTKVSVGSAKCMPRGNTLPDYLPLYPVSDGRDAAGERTSSMRDHGSTCQCRHGAIVTGTSLPKSKSNWPTSGLWVVRATMYPSCARAHRQGLHAGVVAHVKMMNRVASTHSEGHTRCSAKNVDPDPQ